MIKIGDYNKLEIIKDLDFGIYLDGGDGIEILMPRRYVPEEYEIGDFIDCFNWVIKTQLNNYINNE